MTRLPPEACLRQLFSSEDRQASGRTVSGQRLSNRDVPFQHCGLRSIISEDGKTYTDQEFALILSKASELARASDASAESLQGISLDEMKAVAAEVGLDPTLVERAARLVPMETGQSRLERILGGPVKYRWEADFHGRLSNESAAHLLSAVRSAAEQQGEGQADSSGMSWHSVGAYSQVLVTAHADEDRTRVRLVVDRSGALVAVGTFTLLGTVMVAIVTVVGFEVIELQSQALGWSVLVGAVLGSLAIGRTVWASTARKFRGQLSGLIDTVSRSLAGSPDNSKSQRTPAD